MRSLQNWTKFVLTAWRVLRPQAEVAKKMVLAIYRSHFIEKMSSTGIIRAGWFFPLNNREIKGAEIFCLEELIVIN